MSEITFEFACRDDCLDKMVPSDLRQLVAERNSLRGRLAEIEGQGKPQQPVEEIMVNTPYDVFTLPLQPSGLDGNGPRFVVHVPGPEQQPAPDVAALVEALEAALMVMTSKEVRLEKQADAITMVRSQLAAHRKQGDSND